MRGPTGIVWANPTPSSPQADVDAMMAAGGIAGGIDTHVAEQVSERGALCRPGSWGQLQPFLAVFSPECVGQLASFGPA